MTRRERFAAALSRTLDAHGEMFQKLAAFDAMSDVEQEAEMAESRRRIERQIREFEQRYEMSSEAMIASGLDTADTSKWARAAGRAWTAAYMTLTAPPAGSLTAASTPPK